MSLTAAVIDAMIAAGCTAEQLGAAMKAAIADDEARRERKRANNAERQRRFKSNRRSEVTQDNAGNALPSVTPSPSLSPQTPHTHPHPGINNHTRVKDGHPAKPESVKDGTWRDFQALRRAKRAPLSQTALDGIEREASAAGWTLEGALAECVNRGWQGFKAEWVTGKPAANGRSTGPPGNAEMVAQILAQ